MKCAENFTVDPTQIVSCWTVRLMWSLITSRYVQRCRRGQESCENVVTKTDLARHTRTTATGRADTRCDYTCEKRLNKYVSNYRDVGIREINLADTHRAQTVAATRRDYAPSKLFDYARVCVGRSKSFDSINRVKLHSRARAINHHCHDHGERMTGVNFPSDCDR